MSTGRQNSAEAMTSLAFGAKVGESRLAWLLEVGRCSLMGQGTDTQADKNHCHQRELMNVSHLDLRLPAFVFADLVYRTCATLVDMLG
jgi:hypothetical protein